MSTFIKDFHRSSWGGLGGCKEPPRITAAPSRFAKKKIYPPTRTHLGKGVLMHPHDFDPATLMKISQILVTPDCRTLRWEANERSRMTSCCGSPRVTKPSRPLPTTLLVSVIDQKPSFLRTSWGWFVIQGMRRTLFSVNRQRKIQGYTQQI